MRPLKVCLNILAVALFFLLSARPAIAQQTGTISGTVTDNSGGVIPGVSVTLNRGTSAPQTASTDEQGNYSFKELPAGSYEVSFSNAGFKDFKSSAITLAAGQNVRADAVLQPAEATATVTVTGGKAAQVETENAQLAGTITEKEITAVGLNGRNFTQLITLTPGVSNQTGQDEALVGVKGSVKYSVNGGRVEYNTFDVDGSDVLNAGINGSQSTLIVYPSLDAISEVKVLTSNYGAMYGRTASGTVLVTTKSGTNQFHGDGYEFLRNEFFNARNFFDQTPKAPLYRRNDFGFTLGGPLFIPNHYNTGKDKTFFFVSEEFRYEKTPQDFNQAVPSLAERSGNFADVCPFAEPGQNGNPGQQVYFKRSAYPDCPQKSASDTAGYVLTYPGNQVPIDPNAAILLGTGVIPVPTSRTGCNSTIGSCYDASVSPSTYWREDLYRFDQDFTQNTRLMMHFIHDNWNTTTATPQWPYVQNSFPTIQNYFTGPGYSIVAHLSHVFSPTFVNDVSFGFTMDHITLTDVNGPGATWQRPAGLTVGYLFNNGFGGKVPGLVIGGNNAAYGGNGFAVDPSYVPWDHTNPTYTISDNATKVIGKHTLQFGAQYVIAQRNQINNASGVNSGDLQGIISFDNQSSLFTTGNAFADFLTGGIQSFQQESAQSKYYQRYTVAEPFFQDDWKVFPRLTLNLGLRVSLFGLWHEKYDNVYNWEPSAYNPANAADVDPLTGILLNPITQQPIPLNVNNVDPSIINGIVRCGTGFIPAGCMTNHLFNPAPRIGFAWDPFGTGTTSVRGGYGMFFEHGTGYEANTGSLEGTPPQVLNMTQNFPFGYACIGGVGTGCGGQGAYPINVNAIPTRAVWPYVQQWSFSVQRELPKNMVASVAYVGSKGTHLTAALQVNQLAPVSGTDNPFIPGEAITTAICDTFDGAEFTLNGMMLGSGQPGFTNLEAACYGTPSKIFPNPNSLREYAPGIGAIYSLRNIADSTYNALQATLRRTVGPLVVNVAYSYSHSLDDSSDRFDSTFVNAYDLRANKASSNFDQRNLLNMSYVYDFSLLPAVRHFSRAWRWENDQKTGGGSNAGASSSATGIWHTLLDNWEYTGITTFQSGIPFSVINGASGATGISVLDNAGVANGIGPASYPDIIGDPYGHGAIVGGDNPNSFGPILGNPAAFVAPTGLTFGDAGRNALNNPSRLNFDMALLKHVKTSESTTVELRAEAFNIFNHPQFRIFNPDIGNTANNTVSCYGGPNNSAGFIGGGVNCLLGNSFLHPVDAHRPRTIQLGAKFLF